VVDLLVLNGARAGARFSLPDVPTVLGRSPEAHLRIDDPWISNMHALFESRGETLWVVDLGSRNGTFVGEERVEEAQVGVGTVLAFGRTEVRVEAQGGAGLVTGMAHTPTNLEVLRTTVRSERVTTSPGLAPPVVSEADPFTFCARAVALLRLSLTVRADGPPPDARALRQAHDAAVRAVMREGGRTARLGSGGLMAVFGFGGAAADDAARALRAAWNVREDVRTLAAGLPPRLAVDAGPAMAGLVHGPEGAELVALGEPADRVERLVGEAAPGEILVGPGVPGAADPRLEPPRVAGGPRRLRDA
jgi:pSer/pThr/pTyr-binding forkhead associated (FHA) protein